MKTYKKPVVSVDTGLAEGVYAASGATIKLPADKFLLAEKIYIFSIVYFLT